MCKLSSLFIASLFVFPITAQNIFLSFSGPKFHEITPLRTDSMFITAGSQLREIGYDYDIWQRPLQIREKRNDPAQNWLQHIVSDYEYSTGRVVFTTTSEILSPFQSITTDRITIDSLNGRISFFLAEVLDGAQWKGTQKDTFIYNAAGNLLERVIQSWDFANAVWIYQSFEKNEYDAQERLVIQRHLSLNSFNSDTSAYNEYIFTYDAAGRRTSRTWKNWNSGVIQNVFRERYTYDSNDRLDTLKNDIWIAPLNDWYPDNIVVLDDSPEQQITQSGKRYLLNAQSQWYLAKETIFTPGPQIYSDQPSEELIKVFSPNTGQAEDDERAQTTYTDLPDGTIKGDYQRAFFENGDWNTDFHVQAWQRKIGSVSTKEPEQAAVPKCGLPNPLTMTEAVSFPGILLGNGDNQRVELYTMDGRQVFSRVLSNAGGFAGASLFPGIYLIIAHDEKSIICTQKVMVR